MSERLSHNESGTAQTDTTDQTETIKTAEGTILANLPSPEIITLEQIPDELILKSREENMDFEFYIVGLFDHKKDEIAKILLEKVVVHTEGVEPVENREAFITRILYSCIFANTSYGEDMIKRVIDLCQNLHVSEQSTKRIFLHGFKMSLMTYGDMVIQNILSEIDMLKSNGLEISNTDIVTICDQLLTEEGRMKPTTVEGLKRVREKLLV